MHALAEKFGSGGKTRRSCIVDSICCSDMGKTSSRRDINTLGGFVLRFGPDIITIRHGNHQRDDDVIQSAEAQDRAGESTGNGGYRLGIFGDSGTRSVAAST